MQGDECMCPIQKNGLAAFCAFLVLPAVSLGSTPDRVALDKLVEPFLKDKPYLALVVGITRPAGQQTIGYGQAELDGKKQTPDATTIFEIGSITKIFTGTLLADQVRCGVVRLDDPVQRYLPDNLAVPRRDDRSISLLHLATHTSSLPRVPASLGLVTLLSKDPANAYGAFDESRLRQSLSDLKLPRPIGSRFEYSNLGVGLLGSALVRAAKAKSYEDLLINRIIEPLGLADTRLQLSVEQNKRFAPAHNKEGKRTSPWTFATLEACGGLRSTAHDLLLFSDAAMDRRKSPLNEAFRMAQQPWRETSRKGEAVGFCWFRQERAIGKKDMLWHNGGTGGYRSFLGLMPAKSIGVVLLSNSPHPVDDLATAILKKLAEDDSESGPPQK